MRMRRPSLPLSLRLLTLGALLLAACAGQKKIADEAAPVQTPLTPEAYLQAVQDNRCEAECLTAKTKVKITLADKSVSSTGTLRMKKDDVIQLAVLDPILHIAEVGRMEFTTTHVLILDRFNKQYIYVPYESADFLKRANVDFHTLQALFRNELFLPDGTEPQADDYTFTPTDGGSAVELGYADKLLTYRFYTQQPTGTLTRTDITGTRNRQSQFQFLYADFEKFKGKAFPTRMEMSFVMGGQCATLTIGLSSLKDDSGWDTRSTIPDSYTQADAEKILGALVK